MTKVEHEHRIQTNEYKHMDEHTVDGEAHKRA